MRVIAPIFALTAALISVLPFKAEAISASNRYRSPRNPERKVRSSTELIVLHTTEAPARSSLNKLSERGEAHFCVTENGSIYAIVDRDKEAFHAGRSMWNGKEDCDKFSIGIECVGYHDKAMPAIQLNAIRDLVKDLKAMYRLSDDRIVCHSHVAYGAPNKWQKRNHRGRKRCGMLFAMPSVRQYLGLTARPKRDLDVNARRLIVGDEYLRKVLYGNVDTMKSSMAKMKQPETGKSGGFFAWFTRKKAEPPPDSKSERKSAPLTVAKSNPPPASKSSPPAARKTNPAVPAKAIPSARPSAKSTAVVKAKPTGKPPAIDRAVAKPAPKAKAPVTISELKKSGFRIRGSIDRRHTARQLVGDRWNSPLTYYTIRNKVIPGDQIDARRMENGMQVWTR